MKKNTKNNPWRALANDGEIGQVYPAIVQGEQGALTDSDLLEARHTVADYGPEDVIPLPQEVKAPPQQANGWFVLGNNGLEEYQPTIFSQVSNKIRSRMWAK